MTSNSPARPREIPALARRVIIESPFRGDTIRNLRYLRACLHDSLMRGEAPFASHALYTQPGVLDDTIEAERVRGIAAGYSWGIVSDLFVFYIDLGWSLGMQEAYELCSRNHYRLEIRSLYNRPLIGPRPRSSDELKPIS